MSGDMAARVMEWARPLIAIFMLAVFVVAFVVAYQNKDPATLSLLVGAVIANTTMVIQYFFGSSSSSQKKDDTIASALSSVTPPKVEPVSIGATGATGPVGATTG